MRRALVVLSSSLLAGCSLFNPQPQATPPPPPGEPLPVQVLPEEVVVAAWSEPRTLLRGGGEAQILVRVQRRGGAPYPGVEVRLATTAGTLFSQGAILLTDARGMTRDRLTTRQPAIVTLNAGGTRYRFHVGVGDPGR